MKRMTIVGLLVLVVINLLPAFAVSQRQESRVDDLVFAIELPRTEYLEGEPIVAAAALTNNSREPRRLAEPEYGLAFFIINPEDPGDDLPQTLLDSIAGVPDDYGWEFLPGETRRSYYDIQLKFAHPLPVGRYKIHAVYRIDARLRDVWHGRIATPDISFSVVEPSSEESSAVISLKDARTKQESGKPLEAAKVFAVLKDSYFGGRLADYAGFWEAAAYGAAGDRKSCRTKFEDYVKEHSGVPYYGRRAIEVLANELCRKGDYQSAKEVLTRLPDSYMRRKELARCDKLQTKQNAVNAGRNRSAESVQKEGNAAER